MGSRPGVRFARALEYRGPLGRSERVERPFPTLRRVLSAGAPVPAATLEKLRKLIDPDAEIVTPYGATEALPIASIESREVIAETGPAAAKGKGTCVGTRFEGVQWRVIEIEDGPIEDIDETQEVARGKIGELMVSGPMVTERYVVRCRPERDAQSRRWGSRSGIAWVTSDIWTTAIGSGSAAAKLTAS